ncbi:MAG: hypothetical protein Q7K42_03700 [Candidatus Diapherotrites archaeon]|nr:hypothetical protein [Candidatus Diapherotrites archaeon]
MGILVRRFKRDGKIYQKYTKVTGIKKKHYLGGHTEGDVHLVDLELEKRGRKKTVEMVEKRFTKSIIHVGKNYHDPVAHFRTANELIELNREKNLGLRLPSSVRIIDKGEGKFSLIMPKISNLVDAVDMPPKQKKEFEEDMYRQMEILDREGYLWHYDWFAPKFDRATKKFVAVIVDFGSVVKSHSSPRS